MKFPTRRAAARLAAQILSAAVLCAALQLSWSSSLIAQNAPPRQDHPATKPNVGKFYQGAGAILGATVGAMVHVYEFTRDLVTPGNGSAPDAFKGLKEGSIVVVHYPPDNAGLSAGKVDPSASRQSVEGTVRNIDNRHKEITVRFDSRTTETFQLAERAATAGEVQAPTGPDDVVIEFTGATGQRVSHPFRKKS
jgi:hypothetical protein